MQDSLTIFDIFKQYSYWNSISLLSGIVSELYPFLFNQIVLILMKNLFINLSSSFLELGLGGGLRQFMRHETWESKTVYLITALRRRVNRQ